MAFALETKNRRWSGLRVPVILWLALVCHGCDSSSPSDQFPADHLDRDASGYADGVLDTTSVSDRLAPDDRPPADVPDDDALESGLDTGGRADAGGNRDASTDAAPGASCTVGPVPASTRSRLTLSTFYHKYVDVNGFPIVSSPKVPDKALCVAKSIVTRMVAKRPDALTQLINSKVRLGIMAESELTTDIPEHADLTPKDYWDQRARGLGATESRPAVTAAEENILCYPTDRYKGESILIHEFSHTIDEMGIEPVDASFAQRLTKAYHDAIAQKLWANTYAASNQSEYWAEGAQAWFDAAAYASPANGVHNEINTRTKLKAYDATLAALLGEAFRDDAWRYSCPP